MRTSEGTKEIASALAKAQSEMGRLVKDKTARVSTKSGTSYSFSYADLATLLDIAKPALSKYGIAIVQAPSVETINLPPARDGEPAKIIGRVTLETRLSHDSGEWLESSLTVMAEDVAPQKIGSAITYARRYALSCMIGVASEDDDDGNSAGGNQANIENRAVTPDQKSEHLAKIREQVRDPKGRKVAVLKWFVREYGEVGYRPKVAAILDRQIPQEPAEIHLRDISELEKLEQHRNEIEVISAQNHKGN